MLNYQRVTKVIPESRPHQVTVSQVKTPATARKRVARRMPTGSFFPQWAHAEWRARKRSPCWLCSMMFNHHLALVQFQFRWMSPQCWATCLFASVVRQTWNRGEVSQILSDLKCPICSHYIRLSTNLSLVSKTSNNHWNTLESDITLVFHGGIS